MENVGRQELARIVREMREVIGPTRPYHPVAPELILDWAQRIAIAHSLWVVKEDLDGI